MRNRFVEHLKSEPCLLDEQLPGGRAFAYAVALRLLAEVVEDSEE